MANARQAEAEATASIEEPAKKQKRLSQSKAAKRQRAYRGLEKEIANIPPVPTNITPAMLREAVRETGELLTKTLTRATQQGLGHSQEAKNLSQPLNLAVLPGRS